MVAAKNLKVTAHIIGYVANYFSLDDNASAENSSVLTKSIRKIDASQKSDKGSTTSTSGNAPVKNKKPSEVNTPKTNDIVDSKSLSPLQFPARVLLISEVTSRHNLKKTLNTLQQMSLWRALSA